MPKKVKIAKVENLVANLHDKNESLIHIRNLKQVLNDGLFMKTLYRVIKFNQKSWLKSYMEMNIELRKKKQKKLQKIFFQADE